MNRTISRRKFCRVAAGGAAAIAIGPKLSGQPATLARKPNLLVFLPDQLRRGAVACYGADKVRTPNFDKLASISTVFEHAYVTQPICVPSRSSLLTGTWPHANGCIKNSSILDPKYLCVPEMISDHDYRTGYMGKWHLADEVFPQHGFEEWISIEDEFSKKFLPGRDKKAVSDYCKFLISKGQKPDKDKRYFGARFTTTLPVELRKPKFLETHACDFLDRHQHEPFILFVAFREPHPPYHGPLASEYSLEEITFEPSSNQNLDNNVPLHYRLKADYYGRKFGTTLEAHTKLKQQYLGMVTEVDRSTGAILEKLQSLGLTDQTMIIFTSDHGDMMGAHRLFGKSVTYEESVSVPYMIHLPGQNRTNRVSRPVSHIDFVPTILDLLGKPPHPQCVGRSIAPLVKGGQLDAQQVFVQWAPGNEAKKTKKTGVALASPDEIREALKESTRALVSLDGWKLCLRDKDKNELYNLRDDPGEEHNLYYDNRHQDQIKRFSGEIHAWQERNGDTLKV